MSYQREKKVSGVDASRSGRGTWSGEEDQIIINSIEEVMFNLCTYARTSFYSLYFLLRAFLSGLTSVRESHTNELGNSAASAGLTTSIPASSADHGPKKKTKH